MRLSSCRLKFLIYHLSSLGFKIDMSVDFGFNFRFPHIFQSCIFTSLETNCISFIKHKSLDMGEKYTLHSREKARNSRELCTAARFACNFLYVKLTIGWIIDHCYCTCLLAGCGLYETLIMHVAKAIMSADSTISY